MPVSNKECYVGTRLTQEEKVIVDKRADSLNLRLSEYLRKLIE